MKAKFADQLNAVHARLAAHHAEWSRILAAHADLEAKRAAYWRQFDYNTRELGDPKSLQTILDEAEYDVKSVELVDRYNRVVDLVNRDQRIRNALTATVARRQLDPKQFLADAEAAGDAS